MGLKKRGSISLLKKYLNLEKKWGDEASVAKILERARNMAASYENIDDEDDEVGEIL